MVLKISPLCAVACAMVVFMAGGASAPAPVLLDLNRGESALVKLANGAERTVRLLDYRESGKASMNTDPSTSHLNQRDSRPTFGMRGLDSRVKCGSDRYV